MGQINIRLAATDDAEFDEWAAELEIKRGALGRRTVLEALAARREGRALFERSETLSPADLQRLIGQVDTTMVELDRVLLRNAERDALLAKNAREDTAGISEARTAIISQVAIVIDRQLQPVFGALADLSDKTANPPAIAAMHADMKALQAEIGDNRVADLDAAREGQAEIIRETRKRRSVFMLIIDEDNWSTFGLMLCAMMMAAAAALLIFIAASFFPSIAVPISSRLLRNDDDICQVIDQRYGVADCKVPNMPHPANGQDVSSVMVPRVHRAKHR